MNDDQTEFTFTIRKGLKWSDGEEVTMEDYRFGVEDFVLNQELTPVVAAYMRDGGTSAGDPFTFEIIDDTTFKLIFKQPTAASRCIFPSPDGRAIPTCSSPPITEAVP